MQRSVLAILACLSFTGCNATETSQPPIPRPEAPAILDTTPRQAGETEHLLARTPEAWKIIYQLNTGGTRLTDFIAPGEAESNWTTKLSFEAHQELVDADPIGIIMGEIQKASDICTGLSHFNLFSGLENGYPTSVRLMLCGENAHNGQGEISLTKAIAGKEFFYVIRLLKKLEPFEGNQVDVQKGEVAEWSTYLKTIRVCDTRRSEHACPEDFKPGK